MPIHTFNNPGLYSQNNALQYNFTMQLLGKIFIAPESRILDLGCGDGLITNEVAKIVEEGVVVGTDISNQMISYANQNYTMQRNLCFYQMDASKNTFCNEFDVITSFNCLHWVKNQEAVIKGIVRASQPGAQVILLFSHRKSLYHTVLDKVCSNNKWGKSFLKYVNPRYFFDLAFYKDLLIKSGLEIIELKEDEMIYHFKTPSQLKMFFSASGAQMKLIPYYLRDDFLNDFVTYYKQESQLTVHKEIPVGFWCLQIIARLPE
ncbi:MAG TPA: class I SAM-dependent methyltransferase [Legionella sp.]|nr:class I SAM-dependent methyltransferase [Legionella sp.]